MPLFHHFVLRESSKMNYFSSLSNKLEHLCKDYLPKRSSFTTSYSLKTSMFHYIISHATSFWLHLCYFIVVSLVGYMALKVSKPRTNDDDLTNLNLFFTSVSATTVSSMTTIEMEVFSNDQLIVMTILMIIGGEVFTSMIGLQLRRCKSLSIKNKRIESSSHVINSIELGTINQLCPLPSSTWGDPLNIESFIGGGDDGSSKYINTIKCLSYVVLGYIIVVHVVGSSLVTMYMSLAPRASNVLKSKGLNLHTFSFFVVVSTFSSCGFVPTNENMAIFRNHSGLLWVLIPQIFLGNSLYPPCLRLVIWVLERFTKRKEFDYMLNNYEDLGYGHLLSSKKSWYLSATTLAFLVLQLVMFCVMEWSSGVMDGMSTYQKLVGSLFQTANIRHSGESIVDISSLSGAILVLFTIMMYLPAYTSFLPIEDEQEETLEAKERRKKNKKKMIVEHMLFSQLSYLVIFVIVICITERKSLKEDPLNFNVLTIVFEVISAYGNVGLSTGYSCERRLNTSGYCKDKLNGFCGRWSSGGKIALIVVMFFGRLKKFNMRGGKAWIMF